jgi:hypothetical protein
MVRNDVWHQLEVPNGTETPWTTGSVLLLQGDLPLAQELLGYTARGATALVPVTVAVDVQGSYEQREVERRRSAVTIAGYSYALVRRQVDLRVVNRRAERADVRITVRAGGRATTASEGGRIRLDAERSTPEWDNRSTIEWDASVEPGATAAFTCEVEFLVRER